MSRDIRSFFQTKKVQKAKVEEDDDIIPESPDVQIKVKKKESRKKRVLSDSDEEIFTTKKTKSNDQPQKSNKNKPSKPVLKEVKAVDMFGGGPIKRTEPMVKKEKRKKNTETGIHSDDDFDKSLLELDEIEEISSKPKETPSTSSAKQDDTSASKVHNSPDKSVDKRDSKEQAKTIKTNSSENDKSDSKVKIEKEKSPYKPKDSKQIKENERNNKESRNEHKSRLDSKIGNDKKRKFTEFLESESTANITEKDEERKSKKNKLNESVTEKANKNKEVKKQISSDANDSDATIIEDHDMDQSMQSSKKKKLNKTLNDSVLTDEERHERKMHSAALYKSYLNRSGPKHLGAKEMPEGAPDCLKDCAFLLTGVLDSFEREEITETVVKYGGCIKNSISKKVTHVLAGDEAGPAKMAKAQELGIKIISEDDFIKMIKDSVNKKSKDKIEIKKEKSPSEKSKKEKHVSKEINGVSNKTNLDKSITKKSNTDKHNHEKTNGFEIKEKKPKTPNKVEPEIKIEKKVEVKSESKVKLESKTEIQDRKKIGSINETKSKSCEIIPGAPPALMWVDKYKPQNLKQIIGQHGDASNVKKLSNWLTKWYVNRKAKLAKPSPWAKNDDGGYFKAALLSGPPGVGKTTTVALVCKELGFDMVEFNASDTRSKNLIKEQISELLTTTSLSAYAKGDTGKQAVTKKHVLVMDEVDGMAGNEDRGGLQELIGLIKATSVPIVCMCNDRNSQKMRSLVNYCYDLRFSRPRVDQIKSAMMSICFKEGLKIPPDVLTQLIVAANQDVRQTLHLLSMWSAETSTDPDKLRKDATSIRKDIKLGPWEAIRKVFSAEDHKTMSINDKSDLFFYDYSLAPLFVQENYLQVSPHCPKNEVLDRVSKAADSISAGDQVDARIRRSQAWGLLPMQAMYSSVIPGHVLSGHMAGQIQFPGWLGKNSRAGKLQRLCQEIHAHTRLSTSGSKSSIFLDYSAHLRDAIVTPLVKDRTDGITKAMEVLESYHLLREDLDSLVELSVWPGQRNPMVLVDSKVKAAMTRTYNKSATALPYAPAAIKKGRARDDEAEGEDDEPEDEPDDSDPENDALIKKKKTNEKAGSSKEKSDSSKEKASTSKAKPGSSKEKKKK